MDCRNFGSGGSGAAGGISRADGIPLLAVFAVEKIAHGASARFVGFLQGLALVGIQASLRRGCGEFLGAAGWAAIDEAGFIRFELEFLGAHCTDSERKCHSLPMIQATRKIGHALFQTLDLRLDSNFTGWRFLWVTRVA